MGPIIWLSVAASIAGIIVGGAVIGGVRVIAVGPLPQVNLGPATMLISNLHSQPLIDSPEAICSKRGKAGDDFCAAGALAGMANQGKVLVKLPYSETLYRMTGAPEY